MNSVNPSISFRIYKVINFVRDNLPNHVSLLLAHKKVKTTHSKHFTISAVLKRDKYCFTYPFCNKFNPYESVNISLRARKHVDLWSLKTH